MDPWNGTSRFFYVRFRGEFLAKRPNGGGKNVRAENLNNFTQYLHSPLTQMPSQVNLEAIELSWRCQKFERHDDRSFSRTD